MCFISIMVSTKVWFPYLTFKTKIKNLILKWSLILPLTNEILVPKQTVFKERELGRLKNKTPFPKAGYPFFNFLKGDSKF